LLLDVHSVAQWLMQTQELLRQCVHRHEAGLLTGGEQIRVVEWAYAGRDQDEATTRRVASPPSDAGDVENESLVTTAASWERRKTPPAQNLGVTCGATIASDSDDNEQILCAAGAPSPKYEKDKPVEDNTSSGASGIEKTAAVQQHDAAVSQLLGSVGRDDLQLQLTCLVETWRQELGKVNTATNTETRQQFARLEAAVNQRQGFEGRVCGLTGRAEKAPEEVHRKLAGLEAAVKRGPFDLQETLHDILNHVIHRAGNGLSSQLAELRHDVKAAVDARGRVGKSRQ
jgi:hypothetical protein